MINIEELRNELQTIIDETAFYAKNDFIQTGIDIFDIYAGGGFMLGTFNMLCGFPGCGKSTFAINVSANVQKKYEDAVVIYFDTENAVSKKRLKQLGVKEEKLLLISGNITIETIFQTIDKMIEFKDKKKSKKVPFVIVWDSLAFTPSKRALAGDDIQNTDGMIRAKIIAEYLPRYLGLFQEYNFLMLVINQMREKANMNPYGGSIDITVKGLGNVSIPGGKAPIFGSFHLPIMSVQEFLSKDSYGFDGAVIKCKLVKNKAGTPNKEFFMVLDYKKGFDNFWTNYYYLKKTKRLVAGSWNYLKDLPEVKFRTKDAKKKYLEDSRFREVFDKEVVELYKLLKMDVEDEIELNLDDGSE